MGPRVEITSGTGLEPNLSLGTSWKQPAGASGGLEVPWLKARVSFAISVHQPCTVNSIPSGKGLYSELTVLSLRDLNWFPSLSASGAAPQLKSLLPVTAPLLWEVKGGGSLTPASSSKQQKQVLRKTIIQHLCNYTKWESVLDYTALSPAPTSWRSLLRWVSLSSAGV